MRVGISARRDSSCRSTPGSARLAGARFAHPGLLPVARFGAEEDGFCSDAYPRLRAVFPCGDTRPGLQLFVSMPVEQNRISLCSAPTQNSQCSDPRQNSQVSGTGDNEGNRGFCLLRFLCDLLFTSRLSGTGWPCFAAKIDWLLCPQAFGHIFFVHLPAFLVSTVQGCGSKRSAFQTGVGARRDSSCRSTPGNARLAMARFAHPGLLPVARFGAEEDGTLLGFAGRLTRAFPGCAARPWALGCNGVAVSRFVGCKLGIRSMESVAGCEDSTYAAFPRRGFTPKPRVSCRRFHRQSATPGTLRSSSYSPPALPAEWV